MKKRYVLLILLFLRISAASAQLNDSAYVPGQQVKIPRILFDMGRATLRPESYDSLDVIVAFLKKHDNLVVELSNHTDTRTFVHSCSMYSTARAQACAEYIASKGIARERIVAKGYGEKKPLITDAEIAKLKTVEEKEAAHQKNRRTELRVLRTDHVPVK